MSGSCPGGAAIASVNPDGTVACAPASGPPTGPAGGDLTGSYPSPTLAPGSVGTAAVNPASVQLRLSGDCTSSAGRAVTSVSSTGTQTCTDVRPAFYDAEQYGGINVSSTGPNVTVISKVIPATSAQFEALVTATLQLSTSSGSATYECSLQNSAGALVRYAHAAIGTAAGFAQSETMTLQGRMLIPAGGTTVTIGCAAIGGSGTLTVGERYLSVLATRLAPS